MIPFNVPAFTGNELEYVLEAIKSKNYSGDGFFSKKCQEWFEINFQCKKALITPSCTSALDMAAILLEIEPGDEVIMPSFTFVSTANAFVLRGAKIVFVDIEPKTMNIDVAKIEKAITSKTKAIVPVHYAGVSCDMDTIMNIANLHDLYVVEDAAQAVMSSYKGKHLGTIGHIGTYSFHETKNYTSGGEGGLLLVNDERFIERAEIIREKGTNRSQFFKGHIDKYTWIEVGGSHLPSELQASFLWGQLQNVSQINKKRLRIWKMYYEAFKELENQNQVELPVIPLDCKHNAHMFYLKLINQKQRDLFINHLAKNDINAVFHYIPLHSSPAGKKFGKFYQKDIHTTFDSSRLVRLPLFFELDYKDVKKIISKTLEFFD